MVKPIRGMVMDTSPLEQPEGTWNYARNGILSDRFGTVSNEPGTTIAHDPGNIVIIGSILLDNEDFILFGTSVFGDSSSVLYFNPSKNELTPILISSGLNFSVRNRIHGTFKRSFDGDITIYWTDNYNPPRFLNIDNPSSIPSEWNIFRTIQTPFIDVTVNDTGGSIETGSYQFFVQYESEAGIVSSWIGASNPVPVLETSVSTEVDDVVGSESGIPTSKSITLSLSNLDTNYQRVNIAAVKTVDDVSSIKKTISTGISSPTLSLRYTGHHIEDLLEEEVSIRKSFYKTAKHVVQNNNTLFWAGLTERDEIDYQKIANDIQVTYRVENKDAKSTQDSYTNPENTTYNKSLLRDEIYAFCIYFELTDGTITRGFHIPGRSPNATHDGVDIHQDQTNRGIPSKDPWGNDVQPDHWDTEMVNDPNGEHSSSIRRWRLYNTAYRQTGSNPTINLESHRHDVTTGQLAYWESELTYPDIPEIWGDRSGTRIRHHKMPSAIQEPITFIRHGNTPIIRPLYAEFHNINIPDELKDSISSIHIGAVARSSPDTKSIIDKGFLFPATQHEEDDRRIFTYPFTTTIASGGIGDYRTKHIQFDSGTSTIVSETVHGFIGPNTQARWRQTDISASHFNIEARCHIDAEEVNQNPLILHGRADSRLSDTTDASGFEHVWDIPEQGYWFRYLRGSQYIGNNIGRSAPQGGNIYEIDHNNRPQMIHAETENSFFYQPSKLEHERFYGSSWGGAFYTSLKRDIRDMYGNIENLVYNSTGFHKRKPDGGWDSTESITRDNSIGAPGDVFISRFTYKTSGPRYFYDGGFEHRSEENSFFGLMDTYTESEVNLDYRLIDSSEDHRTYHPHVPSRTEFLSGEQDGFGRTWQGNYVVVNEDYNIGNQITTVSGVGREILEGKRDQSIIWARYIPQSRIDGYLNYRIDDYTESPNNKGPITHLAVFNNELYIVTTQAMFRAFTREDRLELDELTAVIGTGDMFSIPDRQLISADEGYMGSVDISYSSNKHGLFTVDTKRGKVFHISDSPQEISGNGMYHFFREFFASRKIQEDTNDDFPEDVPLLGSGVSVGYDPIYDRIIITRRDMKLKNPGKYVGMEDVFDYDDEQYMVGDIVLDINTYRLHEYRSLPVGNTWVPLVPVHESIDDGSYELIDISFTLSYYPYNNSWGFFHDYWPATYFNNGKALYGYNTQILTSGEIHEHSDEINRCTFYGSEKPFILQTIHNENPLIDKRYVSLRWNSRVFENNRELFNKTFDRCFVFNDYQASNIENLEPLNNVRRREKKWFFNRFRDKVPEDNTDPIFKDRYKREINEDAISIERHWSKQRRFIDKYLGIRLESDATTPFYIHDIIPITREVRG